MKGLTKTSACLLVVAAMFLIQRGNAQSILNPADPVITYNSSAPPTEPAWGQIGKWVRTKRLTWNTDSWKAYIYKTIPFRLKFPKSYNPTANDGKKYPMIVFFHGAGESGTKYDNEFSMANGGPVFTNAVDNGAFDGYILIMQMPGSGWSTSYIDFATEISEYMFANNKLDPFRIMVNGLSAGAGGCWDMQIRHPNYVAACLPMSGMCVCYKDSVRVYKYTPIWYFQGGLDKSPDPNTSLEVKAVIDQNGGNFKYTLYPTLGHGTWNTAWAEPDFFPFCMRAYAANPYTLFGRTEFCPGDAINVTVGVAPYYNAYQWRKNGVLISGATSNSINVTDTGTYDCRMLKGATWSDWSRTPVIIKLKAPTVTPPIGIAGLMSKVIPAVDTDKVTLKVSGNYVSYLWQKVGNSATIGTDSTLSVATPGDYIVKVTEQFGCSSSFSAPFTVVNANGSNKPSPAGNLIASTVSKTSIRLDWSDNPSPQFNETNYEIYQSLQPGSGYRLIGITGADVINFVVAGLTPKTKYYFKVRAVNNFAASAASNEASATTDSDLQPPTAPGNLVISGTSRNSISLSWNASTDDIGVVRYKIYINGKESYPTTSTQFTVSGLTPKQSYNFTVKAIDGAGNQSPFSNQVTGEPLLNGIGYKYYTFVGNWSKLPDFTTLTPDVTGIMPNIAITPRTQNDNFAFLWEGYINIPTSGQYSFRTNSDDGSRLWLGSLNGVLSPYSYSGTPLVNNDGLHGGQNASSSLITLTAGIYPIAVGFFEQGGGEAITVSWRTPSTGTSYVTIPNSAFQETAANNGSAPAAPSNLTATSASYKRINLSWGDNSNNETGFEIWRSTVASTNYLKIGQTAANVTSYADSSDLNASTTYYYKLRAIGQFGESASIPVNDAEANWHFNGNYSDTTGKHTLTANNSPTFNSADKQEGSHSVDLNGSSQDMTVTTSSGDYLRGGYTQKTVAFWMRADNTSTSHGVFDFGGNDDGLALHLNSNTLTAGIASNSTRRSISTSYSNTGWNHIALVYSGSALRLYVNGSQVASNTSLGFSSVGTTSDASMIGDDNGTDALNTTFGQFDGRFDDFFVFNRALTAAEIAALMNNTYLYVSAATQALPAIPSAPTTLLASGTSTSAIAVSWTDNANNETGYELYRSNNNNSNYIKLTTLAANSNSYADTGLFSNSVYYYKIRAIGAGGNSAYSNEDSAKSKNNSPVITAIPNQTMHYSSTLVLNVQATDVDATYITLNVTGLPAFATFQQSSSGVGAITFVPNGTQGTFNGISVSATDETGGNSSTSFNLVVNSNYTPTISPVSDYTLTENQTVNINLIAQDQNAGDVLSWSVNNLPNNYTLTPGANGSATLSLNPGYAAAGDYTVQVNVNDGNGGVAATQFHLTVNDKDPTTKIYARVKYANDIGSPWNNMTGISTNSLKDEFNNVTTVGVNFQQSWWLPYNAGPVTGNNSGVYPDAVLNDFWYFGYYGGPETASVAVTGLDPAQKYKLTFYGGSVYNGVPDNGTTLYTVGGTTVSLNVQNNTQNTVSISNITPDASGNIVFSMAKASGTPIGYLNALVITKLYDDGSIPAAPKLFAGQYVSGQGIVLSWQDVAFNESGYELYRAQDAGGPYSLISSPAADATTFTDPNVSGSTQYYYKLRAVSSHGNSDYTDVVSVLTTNRIPQIAPIADVQVKSNQTAVVNVSAVDDPTDHITLTATGLPSFATFTDNGNGTGVVNIQPLAGSLGTYSGITITATDNSDSSRSVTFNIYVTDASITSAYINITKDDQIASSPWNNLVIPFTPFAGLALSNIKDDANTNTGISVTLTDAWDAASATGVRFRNGTELYPEQVAREGIYFTNSNTHRITVTGLNPARKYNFVFFNSQGTSESALTNFTINSATVTLEGSYNNNKTVQINGIVPPANGTVTINVTKDPSASFAMISSMIIQSYVPASVTILNPTDLRVTNRTTSSISIQWQDRADNETGYEIWRAPDGGSYSLLTTLGPNVTSFTNSGLSGNTTYNYLVRAITGSVSSTYSNAATGYTYASTVSININSNANVAPAPWNNLNWIFGIGASWNNFLNQNGVPTNIGMLQTGKMDGMVNAGYNTGNNSGIYPDKVMAESFGLFPGTASSIKITGLNLSKTYDITLFASLVGFFGDNSTAYTINGKTCLLNAQNNKSGVLTMFGITPDDNGEVLISFQTYETATFGLLGALVISDYDASQNAAPQPPASSARKDVTKEQTNNTNNSITQSATRPEENKNGLLKAYPNPFSERFTLVVPVDNNKNVRVEMNDINGRLIYQKQFADLKQGQVLKIEPANRLTAPGVYLVRIIYVDENKEQVIRMVKQTK